MKTITLILIALTVALAYWAYYLGWQKTVDVVEDNIYQEHERVEDYCDLNDCLIGK